MTIQKTGNNNLNIKNNISKTVNNSKQEHDKNNKRKYHEINNNSINDNVNNNNSLNKLENCITTLCNKFNNFEEKLDDIN